MPKRLSRKTLSPCSGSLVLSSRIMGFSLIANPLGDTVVIWGLQIGTLPQLNPQWNGQAEAVNKVILNGLKKRLDDAKGR